MYCWTCYVELKTQGSIDTHYRSEAHSKAAKFQNNLNSTRAQMQSEFYCEICSIFTTSSQSLFIHLDSAKHKEKLKIRDLLLNLDLNSEMKREKQTSRKISLESSYEKSDYYSYSCDICYVKYTSETQKTQHLSGKEHLKRSKRVIYADSDLSCEICNTISNSKTQFYAHLLSPNHKNQLEKYEEYKKITYVHKLKPKSITPMLYRLDTDLSSDTESVGKLSNTSSSTDDKMLAFNNQKKLSNNQSKPRDEFTLMETDSEIFKRFCIEIYQFDSGKKMDNVSNEIEPNIQQKKANVFSLLSVDLENNLNRLKMHKSVSNFF